jgi:drug/metabolite transporter (DMT)-like permease
MTLTGANVVVAKVIVAVLPLATFLIVRFALASALLAVLAAGEAGPRLVRMNRAQRRDLFFMALFGMVGFTVLLFAGLARTAAADAGIITAALPAVVALLGVVLFGDRLGRRKQGAVALAVAGLALVGASGAATGEGGLLGDLMVAGAVLCEAGFVILGKRLAPPYRPLRLALGANVVALVVSLPLAVWQGAPFATAPGAHIWALVAWYSLAASVITLWLWYRGLPDVETSMAGLATAAVPLTAVVCSAVFLGEPIGAGRLAGGALVIAAIVLAGL